MSVVPHPPSFLPPPSPAGPSNPSRQTGTSSPRNFDVIASYRRALDNDNVAHPIAAIMALVELMEASTASTITGLASELTVGRRLLIDTQPSLGVRAGCQLWERFVATFRTDDLPDFPNYKKDLIDTGRLFCSVTAGQCREKIAALAVDFLRDDCVILTHSFSRTVIKTILRAHAQHKRVKVYVTEARPSCLGLRTHQILTEHQIPCEVILDSAVAYVMERVDMVLVGSEAVVESGGLVSSVGTYQVALVAKAMQKPFYALAESYKFLRHYPLSQTDLPLARLAPGASSDPPLTFPAIIPQAPTNRPSTTSTTAPGTPSKSAAGSIKEMSAEMIARNPMVDITTPDLIDFIITDLGAPLSPTSVSQYLVAQFSS
ncbi:hypothetical protein BCR39DRAFT_542987 [Naematelia encephala]|uniref:Translation initiation factor eIF2B subunit alpha n=1 Tax=Naematelia encephala TaxID=71784 RepID=A0A1Y2ATE2_9TREE|nr:hypothetical protein BCR39DRAFT_542987 [Naematelia encephala]